MPSFAAQSTPSTSTSSSPAPPRPNSPLTSLSQHPDYYLPGGDLFIQINDTLFSIHRYFLIRKSIRWVEFLCHTTQGTSTNDPIILVESFEIVPIPTVESFSKFLWVFYNPDYSYLNTPVETWWTIEAYATYFQMESVLRLVHRELHTIVQRHHQRQRPSTIWQTLSQIDGSDNPSIENTDDRWTLSEEPYENWIANPEIEEEVSLLLNRPHLQDGRD